MLIPMKYVVKEKKTGKLQYRRPVPPEIQEALGRKEIYRSFGTSNSADVSRRYPAIHQEVEQLFITAKSDATPRQQISAARAWVTSTGLPSRRKQEAGPRTRKALAELSHEEMDRLYEEEAVDHAELARDAILGSLVRPDGTPVSTKAEYRAKALFQGNNVEMPPPTLAEALSIYLKEMGRPLEPTKQQPQDRRYMMDHKLAIRCLSEALPDGDKTEVTTVTRTDAVKMRDRLIAQGVVPETLRKRVTGMQRIFQTVYLAEGIDAQNPFTDLKRPTRSANSEREARRAWHEHEELLIMDNLSRMGSQLQLAVHLMACTGCRLVDAIYMDTNDIQLTANIPHVWIRPNRLHQNRKKGSPTRAVPIVDPTCLELLRQHPDGCTKYHRPRGNDAASGAISKFYKASLGLVDPRATNYSFRHLLIDKLRRVGCPEDIRMRIVGHTPKSVHERVYGSDELLELKAEWLTKALAA